MKKSILLTSLLVILSLTSYTQQLSKEFGVISKNELDFTYEKDPEAEAVVLFDIGKSIFFDTETGGYDIRFTRRRRIKILDRAGIEYGEVAIPYYVDGYGKTERLMNIEAVSYNFENGQLVKKELDANTVFEEKINNRWNVKKFVFPDVKEGTIIEYKYVLETPFHFKLPDWEFQDRIPTVYSEYTTSMIPFYEYVFLAQGMSKFDHYESKKSKEVRSFGNVTKSFGQNVGSGFEFNDIEYLFVMEDVPAFRDESFITSPDDYLMKIDFQLAKFHRPNGSVKEIMTTWPVLVDELLKHDKFGKYIKKSGSIVKKVLDSELDLNGKSDVQKSKIIIEYVKSNYDWNGYYSQYASQSPKEFTTKKTGNAADINLFLISLLKAAGVDASPIILSTRNHGKIKIDYPFDHFFNYVAILINGSTGTFLSDGTDNLIAYNRLPLRCINEMALVIAKGETKWISLYNQIRSLDNKIIAIDIDPENSIASASINIQTTEFDAYNYKHQYGGGEEKLKKYFLEEGFKNIEDIKTYNFDKSSKPYSMLYKADMELESIAGKLLISPFLNFPIKENKLTQKERSYPVDFIYLTTKSFKSIINIPDGFQVSSIPSAYELDDALAQISLSYTQNDDLVEAKATYRFKKPVYTASEYSKIKSYFDLIVEKLNEQIILEKP